MTKAPTLKASGRGPPAFGLAHRQERWAVVINPKTIPVVRNGPDADRDTDGNTDVETELSCQYCCHNPLIHS